MVINVAYGIEETRISEIGLETLLGGLTQFTAQFGRGNQAAESVGQCVRITRVDEYPVAAIVDLFRLGTIVGGHHSAAPHHALQVG